MSKLTEEPLLAEDENRYVMFPIKDQNIWDMYKKQVDCFWRAEEIDLTKDQKDWDSLTDDEKYYIKMIIAFFAGSDGIVLENLAGRFMSDVQLAEARAFYGFQIAMENIHSEVYSLLIDTYIKDEVDKNRLFTALNTFPCIAKKGDWAKKWIGDKRSSFASLDSITIPLITISPKFIDGIPPETAISRLTALPTSVPEPSPTPSQSSKPLCAVEPTAEPLESRNV